MWHLRSAILLSPCLLSWAYSCPAGLHGARVDYSRNRKNVLVLRTVQLLGGLSLMWKIQKPCQMARTVAVRFWCYFWSPLFDLPSQRHMSVKCSRPEWTHNPLCWSCLVRRPPSPHLWLERTSPIFKVNTAQKDPCLVPVNNKKYVHFSLLRDCNV